MRKLIAAMVLGAFLVTVGMGCGGSTPSGTKPPAGDKKTEDKKTTP